MAYNTFSEEQLQHLSGLAKSGDETAYDMLIIEGRRITKAANQRLLSIEKKDATEMSYAYGMALLWNKGRNLNRFKVNKSMDIDTLTKELRRARTFMSQESSTITGITIAEKRFFDILDGYDIHVEESARKKFYEFIRSDTVQDVITYIGEYDIVMDIIANNIDDIQNSFKNLTRQFNAAMKNKEFFDEFVDRMAKGEEQSYEAMYKRHRKRESNIRNRRRKLAKDFKNQASKL